MYLSSKSDSFAGGNSRHFRELNRQKPRIAVLEDHDDTREMLQVALADDFVIRAFQSVPELLSALEQEKFSVVLADIMVPGIDGFSLIKKIRGDSRFADLSVIAVTALARESDHEKGMAAGFTEYLIKPIETSEIAAAIRRHLPQEERPLRSA